MSFRQAPRTVQLMIKSHKTTIFIPAPRETTFGELKERVLSALTQFPDEPDMPSISSTDDFKLCVGRLKKDSQVGKAKFEFEIIDESRTVKELYTKPFDYSYIKFKDSETGDLLPVKVRIAPVEEEDDMDVQ